jgi:hypothetical protein
MRAIVKNYLVMFLGMVPLAMLHSCGGGENGGQNPGYYVPAEHRSLYDELENDLSSYKARVNAEWDGTNSSVHFATALLPANPNVGPQLLDPAYQTVAYQYLDALVALGVDAVITPINYPLLTTSCVNQASEYLAFYATLANAVRTRGLKLLVEHNVLIPGFSAIDMTACYTGLTKQQFGQQRYAEARAIVEQIRPDYLSLVTEPGTSAAATGLSLSAAEWKLYVEGVVTQLATDVPGHTTQLGAGSGIWDTEDYITGFAQVPALGYIDLHVYPSASPTVGYLDRLLDWPDLVHTIDPTKKIVMSEAWLYKAAAAELGGAPINPDFLARDVWSFWQPLDELFLDVLARTAHHKGYELITPFWSRYFFAYLDYTDPTFSGMGAMELMRQANIAAYDAIVGNELTQTGHAFRTLATTSLSKKAPGARRPDRTREAHPLICC